MFPESLRALSAYNSHTIDMFGGLKVVRENKSLIRGHLSLMEEIFEYCFLTRSCINRRGVEDFENHLNLAMRSQRFEDVARNLLGNITGSGGASVCTTRTAGDVQATDMHKQTLRDRLSLWVRAFFIMLAETPLPSAAFDPLRVAKAVVQEVEEEDERKRVMRGLLNDMIYYERVEPWGRSFCTNGAGSVLCIDDVDLGEIVDKARISIDKSLLSDLEADQKPKEENLGEYDSVYKECWEYYKQGRQCP